MGDHWKIDNAWRMEQMPLLVRIKVFAYSNWRDGMLGILGRRGTTQQWFR